MYSVSNHKKITPAITNVIKNMVQIRVSIRDLLFSICVVRVLIETQNIHSVYNYQSHITEVIRKEV